MKARIAAVILALAAAAGVAFAAFHADASRPLPRPHTASVTRATASPSPPIPALPSRFLGVVTNHLAAFDTAAGTRANLNVHYLNWGRPFPSKLVADDAQQGASPLIELEPRLAVSRAVSLRRIAAGAYDAYLRSFGTAIAHTGAAVMVSFAPEMNGSWYSWGVPRSSAAAFVATWRHVHDIVTAAGARKVTWLWQVAREYPGSAPLRTLWPGAAYVSMAGIDGYYEYPDSTFANTLGPSVRAVRAVTGVPVLIAETAVGPAADPVAKIPGLFAAVRRLHLAGLVWFDIAQHQGVHHQDWRLEDNPAALAVFRQQARNYR